MNPHAFGTRSTYSHYVTHHREFHAASLRQIIPSLGQITPDVADCYFYRDPL